LNQFKVKPNTPRDINLKFNKGNVLDNFNNNSNNNNSNNNNSNNNNSNSNKSPYSNNGLSLMKRDISTGKIKSLNSKTNLSIKSERSSTNYSVDKVYK